MNVGQWISQRAATDPHRPFLKDEDGGMRSFDNSQFNRRTNRTAHALLSLGVTNGDRVSVIMLNSSEFLEIFFACAKIGAILVPVNYRLAAPEIAYIIKDSRPKLLVYTADFAEKIAPLRQETDAVSAWFRHSGASLPEDPDISSFVETFSAARAGPPAGGEGL